MQHLKSSFIIMEKAEIEIIDASFWWKKSHHSSKVQDFL